MKGSGWVVAAVLGFLVIGEYFYFQARLDEANTEIARANAEIAKANTEITKGNVALKEAISEIDKANVVINEASQPEVSVKVGFRPALISSGNVAVISNNSNQAIAITIRISRSSTRSRIYETVLDGGATKEIGELEGWAFIAGDTVTVEQDGHKSLSFALN